MGGLKAMELMLSARQLKARPAKALGLVDQVIGRHEELVWAARKAVLSGKKSRGPGIVGRLSNTLPARKLLAGQMQTDTTQSAGRALSGTLQPHRHLGKVRRQHRQNDAGRSPRSWQVDGVIHG